MGSRTSGSGAIGSAADCSVTAICRFLVRVRGAGSFWCFHGNGEILWPQHMSIGVRLWRFSLSSTSTMHVWTQACTRLRALEDVHEHKEKIRLPGLEPGTYRWLSYYSLPRYQLRQSRMHRWGTTLTGYTAIMLFIPLSRIVSLLSLCSLSALSLLSLCSLSLCSLSALSLLSQLSAPHSRITLQHTMACVSTEERIAITGKA